MQKNRLFTVPSFVAVILSIPATVVNAQDKQEDHMHSSPKYPETAGNAFVDDASTDMGIMYYGRYRNHDNAAVDKNEIRVNAFGLNANLQSGWYQGWLGFDASAFANIDLMGGSGLGQSEVLYYNEETGKESSSSRIGRFRARAKFGKDDQHFTTMKAGITDISAGTIGTSAGINAHSYRGAEIKGQYGNISVAYGYADRFMNDWDDELRKMTNSWHQNKHLTGGIDIDYIHSVGGRYETDNYWIDLAVGEGKEFRKNYHIAGSYSLPLSETTKLVLTTYYQSAKYDDNSGTPGATFVKNTNDAATESVWSSSAILMQGSWKFITAYGETKAPDSGEYQLRLTAWGNSDHRNFIQTASTLDDFFWDGQKVVKAGLSYTFDNEGLPGLTLGGSYFYSWDGYNLKGQANENRDAKMDALDFQITYTVQSGSLKGLWIGIFPSFLKVHNIATIDGETGTTWRDINKSNRNDIKVIASYNLAVF